jgi:DNA polymerase-3 subunit delta'
MSAAACNSLLKILEEPPPRTIIFLTTSVLGKVLPTIISRCQLIHFDSLSKDEISSTLTKEYNIDRTKAEFIARISDGSLQKALRIAEEGFEEIRDKAYDFLTQCIEKDELKALIYAETCIRNNDKMEIKKILQALQILMRDLQQIKLGLTDQVINVDMKNSLENLVKRYPGIDPESSLNYIANSVDLIDKNIYIDLIIQNLRQSFNDCITKKIE